MSAKDLCTILLTTFMSMAILYAPQPLFPLLAGQFGVSESTIASLITWSLVPMAIAPLVVGVLMQSFAPRRVLAASMLLLGATEIVFALTSSFWGLIVIRFLQGALVSMLLAATMTYVSVQADRVGRVMTFYVSSSVLGGLVGRLVAGYGAEWVGVSPVLFGYGAIAVGAAALAFQLTPEPLPSGSQATTRAKRRMDASLLLDVLRQPSYRLLYGVVFCAFFVFTALLNFVPFRISDLGIGSTGTGGLAYIGFLLGIATSLSSGRLARLIGGPLRAVAAGSVVLGIALALAWVNAFSALIASIFAASAGFFLVHAILSGYVNHHAGEAAPAVNGLYVAIYYAGGAIGSYVPGLAYEAAGWAAFLGLLGVVSIAGLLLLALVTRRDPISVAPLASSQTR
jgi:YNFM family putative membrane transporter